MSNVFAKTRTTVNISFENWNWSKNNIRNLSVFLDDAISIARARAAVSGKPTLVTCECGATFANTALLKTGGKCPECNAIIFPVVK